DLAHNGAELLNRELHLGESPLQRSNLLHQHAATLVQLAHVVGHLLELLDSCLVVVPVDVDGIHQLVEMLDDSMQASAEWAAAGRAFPIFAERDDAIALLLDLSVLG